MGDSGIRDWPGRNTDHDNLTLLNGVDFLLGPGEIIAVKSWANLHDKSSDGGLFDDVNGPP
jgi:hypothetical protein